MTRIALVDAFASRPFEGNPAAVCLLDAPRGDEWMRGVASETNAPATAFVRAADDGYALRWFTPRAELELCGHGTLAGAHVLWESGALWPDAPARFHTKRGLLTAVRRDGWIDLDFPALVDEPIDPPDGLAEALGATPLYVGRGRLDVVVEVDGGAVARLRPDVERLRRVDARGIIVTGRGPGGGVDFVSRFFAPSVGIDEDAVTGSAHCCLAPFWARRLGTSRLVGRQLSARGGTVRVAVDGDRVRLGGQAVTVFRGEITSACSASR